jgi:hypothetical protein
MAASATETASLIAFMLPSTPYSVQMARFYIRAALAYHNLGDFTEDAETVTGAVAVIVSDPSPLPPVRRDPAEDTENGRGLNMVAALSARWGWRQETPGKAVYAILTRKA